MAPLAPQQAWPRALLLGVLALLALLRWAKLKALQIVKPQTPAWPWALLLPVLALLRWAKLQALQMVKPQTPVTPLMPILVWRWAKARISRLAKPHTLLAVVRPIPRAPWPQVPMPAAQLPIPPRHLRRSRSCSRVASSSS